MATPIPDNDATFTTDEIVSATGARLLAPAAGGVLRGVAIDSRAVRRGNLFVALRGAKHDAARFMPDVVRAGAAGVVVHEGTEVPEGVGVFEVADTGRALGDLAAAHRRRWNGAVVAITGSAGKTSTKELAAAALAAGGARVLRTAGNLNNLVGLPMTVLGLSDDVDLAVIEAGTSGPGEVARLAEIAGPDVGVVTLVAAAHTEGIGDEEAVADEKVAMLMALRPDDVAVYNADDARLRARADETAAERAVTFGRNEGATVRLVEQSIDAELRTRAVYEIEGRDHPLELRLRLTGEAAAMNAAAALAVVVARGESVGRAAGAIEVVEPTAGRMRPVEGAGGVLLIDDSYNANPRSTLLALDTAVELARARGGRALAVLGDMLELGERSNEEHEAVGAHAARSGVALLVGCGALAALAARRAAAAGLRTITAPSVDDGLVALRQELAPGDVVLVKGSRSMGMERIVEGLQAEGSP